MRTDSPWRGLWWRFAAGAGLAAVVVVGGRSVGLAFDPIATVVLALLLAAGSWFLADQFEPAARPMWTRPLPPQRTSAFLVDTRTRRLATTLARAQPGAEFETATVARTLAELVDARGLDSGPGRPARPAISHELTTYLQEAGEGRPKPLNRRVLHAYLKEIDAL